MRIQYKIFIISAFTCILTMLIFHFPLNEKIELDLVSHFFGGVSVVIIITQILTHLDLSSIKFIILLLLSSICLFELVEHLFFTYLIHDIYPYYELFYTTEGFLIFDTILDIGAGIIGGISYLCWRNKYGNNLW